jgi:hypothetical protein
MPQQMTAQDIFRELQWIRFSPRKGRRLSFTWLSGQTGYARTAFYEALYRGYVTRTMAERVAAILQNVQINRNQVPLSTLGEYTDGIDPRGGPRPARRPDDRRLGSMRMLRRKAGGLPGAGTENAVSRGPDGGGNRRSRPRGVGHPNKKTATVDPNAAEQASERSPTIPPVINFDVGKLLMKQLDSSQHRRGGYGFKARRRFL